MDDARAFAALEAATLGDSDLTPVEMCSALALPDHCCYLACAGPLCIGLLWLWILPGGTRVWPARWYPERSRKAEPEGYPCSGPWLRPTTGLAGASFSVLACRSRARVTGTRYELMTRVFAGLVPSPYLPAGWSEDWVPDLADSELDQWRLSGHRGVAVRNASGETVARLAMLPVQTMAYTGYWIEQLWAVNAQAATIALLAGAERAKAASSDEIGILVPAADSSLIRGAHQAGYVSIGEYDIFTVD